jgi:phenylpropionate dioxygenase-like ring-hydroxylating dioxygenase large terminal subunit
LATLAEENRSMVTNGKAHKVTPEEETPYGSAVLGFRNYWYPIFSSKEIGTKAKGVLLLGENIVLMRGQKDGKVYAMDDNCFHRGTLLSSGRGCEFKGTNTITCPYHGWTYDLEDGMCVAVLPEGVGSRVPGKIKQRTYPIQEQKGIVWIWMGQMAPVPLNDDIPNLVVRDDTIVKFIHNVQYGNWRWHAENVNGGHAPMIHRDAMRSWPTRPIPSSMPAEPVTGEDVDGIGVQVGRRPVRRVSEDGSAMKQPVVPMGMDFPGLGRWYVPPLWRRIVFWPWLRKVSRGLNAGESAHGATSGKLFLPGIFRQPHFPSVGNSYYEWYVPVDEDHYIYSQVTCIWAKNPIDRLWKNIWYYIWGKPTGPKQFNNQDIFFVKQTTEYTKRFGLKIYPLTKLTQYDIFHTAWRAYANENARGVGTNYQANGKVPAKAAEMSEADVMAPVDAKV